MLNRTMKELRKANTLLKKGSTPIQTEYPKDRRKIHLHGELAQANNKYAETKEEATDALLSTEERNYSNLTGTSEG